MTTRSIFRNLHTEARHGLFRRPGHLHMNRQMVLPLLLALVPLSRTPGIARRIVAQSTLPESEQDAFATRFQRAAEHGLRLTVQ